MANYQTLKSAIQQVVKQNGNNEITGALLQQSLLAMVNSLGSGYQFMGVATPTTNPGTPDQNVFYFAMPGTYQNFSSIVINPGEVGILKYDGQWQKLFLPIASSEKLKNVEKIVERHSVFIDGGYLNLGEYDGNSSNIFIPLTDLNIQDGGYLRLIVSGQTSQFATYGLATAANNALLHYVPVTWLDETLGIGRIGVTLLDNPTHLAITNINPASMHIAFYTDDEINSYDEKISNNTNAIDNIKTRLVPIVDNDIYTITKTGNGQNQFIDINLIEKDSHGLMFVVKNPGASFATYGLAESSDGTTVEHYLSVIWDDESAGIGHVVLRSNTTHIIVTSQNGYNTIIGFLKTGYSRKINKVNGILDELIGNPQIFNLNFSGVSTRNVLFPGLSGLSKIVVGSQNAPALEIVIRTSTQYVTLGTLESNEEKSFNISGVSIDNILYITSRDSGTYSAILTINIPSRIKSIEERLPKEPTLNTGILCIIDDDGGKYIPDIWNEIIAETGIKMGFACVTGYMSGAETPPEIYEPCSLETLKELYNNGHEIYSHSYTHPAFYSDAVTLDDVVIQCQKSKDWLFANGFCRANNIIVYPGGLGEEKTQKQEVVGRFYEWGIDTVGGGLNTIPIKNKLCVYRINADTGTAAQLKTAIDSAKANNQMLVFMNHAYELNRNKTAQIAKMIEVIEYAQSQNLLILPIGEALHQIYGW